MKLQYGYCCLNTELRKQNIFTSRTCRLNTLQKNGIVYVYDLVNKNLDDLIKIINWNHENDIFVYRMSSQIFPFITHNDYKDLYDIKQFANKLKFIGNLSKKYNQRLTFHISHFSVLASDNENIVNKSIADINKHSEIMDIMGLDKNSVMVIHIGSKKGGKDKSLLRFKQNYGLLTLSAKKRLVIENCEISYSTSDLLDFCKELRIPLVLDIHHYNINPGNIELKDIINPIIDIWKIRKIKPKFHISESIPGVSDKDDVKKRRKHSDYVEIIPDIIDDVLKITDLDLMVEAKMKEKAVIHLQNNHKLQKLKI